MKTVLVSSCLLGITCRWHGKKVRPSSYVKKFIAANPKVKIVPICPEELGGLPTPRPPVKTIRGHVFETCPEKTNRKNVTGVEVTDVFVKGAKKALRIAKKNKCHTAILCRASPSCSKTGITGKLFIENGIEVANTF